MRVIDPGLKKIPPAPLEDENFFSSLLPDADNNDFTSESGSGTGSITNEEVSID
jgi:hypothetical protein